MVWPLKKITGKTILVVEPDEPVSRLLRVALARQGYRVECRTSAGAALDALSARPPDLVILDIDLSDMEGSDLVREARRALAERCPPLATIGGDANQQNLARGAGAVWCLPMPFDLDVLASHVARALTPVPCGTDAHRRP